MQIHFLNNIFLRVFTLDNENNKIADIWRVIIESRILLRIALTIQHNPDLQKTYKKNMKTQHKYVRES